MLLSKLIFLITIITILNSVASIESLTESTSESIEKTSIKAYLKNLVNKMDVFGIFKSSNRIQQKIILANKLIKSTTSSSEPDPSQLGLYEVTSVDDIFVNPVTRKRLKICAIFPKSSSSIPSSTPKSSSPFPVIVIAHGFILSTSQYFSYAIKLASFGYFTILVSYPNFTWGFLKGNHNMKQAKYLTSGLDWASISPTAIKSHWKNMIDTNNAGIMGHSLGGKLSFLAATLDNRFKAVFGIDPVDGMGILVRNEMKKLNNIPTGFVGETIDGVRRIGACAPAATNYKTLFQAANSPSFSITIHGACHFSFLDDIDKLRLIRRVCKRATVSSQSVRDITSTITTAFFQRHLRKLNSYDSWLTGDEMQRRYVASGQVSVEQK